MRGKRAKAIRKLAYAGVPKETVKLRQVRYVKDPKTGVIFATDHRRVYQDSKRAIKSSQRRQHA